MAAEIRLTKELSEVSKEDDTSGVRAVTVSGNRHLLGTIIGPEGTCYEGGTFEIDIQIPDQYPFEPPVMVCDVSVLLVLFRHALLEFFKELYAKGISWSIIVGRILTFFVIFLLSNEFLTILYTRRNLLQKYGTQTSHHKLAPYAWTSSKTNGPQR